MTLTRGVVSRVTLADLSLTGQRARSYRRARAAPQPPVPSPACARARLRPHAPVSRPVARVQIDAAINPGNSGGPVFNQQTFEVVGVAFAGRKDAEGMGFIVPTSVVRTFIAVYEATGTFGRLPSLGLRYQDLTNAALRRLLFKRKTEHHDGMLVVKVTRRSCAEAAGVRPGDILMGIDGEDLGEGEVTFRDHEAIRTWSRARKWARP